MTTRSRPKVESTFDVDKEGLAKLLMERRQGLVFALWELVQNAWDEDTSRVDVTLERTRKPGICRLVVEDDNPEGFADLRHAYTLFAESAKKGDPRKRGRFNLGEKLVVAISEAMTIETVTGTVQFTRQGRTMLPPRRDRGTRVEALLRMTADQYRHAVLDFPAIIPPKGISTTFNGDELERPAPLATTRVDLPTEKSGPDGTLRPTRRKCDVHVHAVLDEGERAMIYELGIPVVESGMPWHVDVQQKIPLNFERNGVTPAYLRELSAVTANAMRDQLSADAASGRWAARALEDPRIEAETVEAIMTARFGDKRASADPNDREAEKIAAAQGYIVVYPGSFSAKAWEAIRSAGAIQPAGKVTPSPTTLFNEQDPNAEPRQWMPEEKWTDGMRAVARYSRALGQALLGFEPDVGFINEATTAVTAFYGGRRLAFNVGRLGYRWFAPCTTEVTALILHEFAHERAHDHLDHRYPDEVARLGALLAEAVATNPQLVDPANYETFGLSLRGEFPNVSPELRRSP